MSIYDDAPDGGGTNAYCGFWYAAEPNAWRWTAGPIMIEERINFLFCAHCLAYCDAMDVVVGDFADLHCVFCGSNDIHLADEIE